MREVVLLHVYFAWIAHSRRTQSPRFHPQQSSFEERRSSSASRPTAAFIPSAAGARFSELRRGASVHVVGCAEGDSGGSEQWASRGYVERDDFYETSNVEIRNWTSEDYQRVQENGVVGGGWDNDQYLNTLGKGVKMPDTPKEEFRFCLRYARICERTNRVAKRSVYMDLERLKASLTDADIREIVESVEAEVDRKLEGPEPTPAPPPPEFFVTPKGPPANPPQAPVVTEGITSGGSYAELMKMRGAAPAPTPAAAPTVATPAQPIPSPPAPVQAPVTFSDQAAPPAMTAENDPQVLRQKYKDYLLKCSQEGRQPRGAILDMIAQLVKDQPPTEKEEADMKEIVQMERRFGLTIHTHLFPAAAPQPVPPAPPATAPQAPAAAADPKSPSRLRLQYKEYLSQCIQEGQQVQGGVLDMITRLLQEKPPTREEELDIKEIASMERQLGLTIHTHLVPGDAVPRPVPAPAVPQFAAAPASPAAAPVADVAVLARDALQRLTAASDLTALDASDRDALLTSLISVLSAVQREIGGAADPAVLAPAAAPVAPQADSTASPAVAIPTVPVPAAAPVAPQADNKHRDSLYYVPGMEAMNVAQYRQALQQKLDRLRHIYDPDASTEFSGL